MPMVAEQQSSEATDDDGGNNQSNERHTDAVEEAVAVVLSVLRTEKLPSDADINAATADCITAFSNTSAK